jgi:hypothetical protein
MKGIRYREEQIEFPRKAEAALNTAGVCRPHGIAEAILYKWKRSKAA